MQVITAGDNLHEISRSLGKLEENIFKSCPVKFLSSAKCTTWWLEIKKVMYLFVLETLLKKPCRPQFKEIVFVDGFISSLHFQGRQF